MYEFIRWAVYYEAWIIVGQGLLVLVLLVGAIVLWNKKKKTSSPKP